MATWTPKSWRCGSQLIIKAILSRRAWDWSAEIALRHRIDRAHLDTAISLRGIERP